jgi:putative PIN family toxin of toxin-antitoxin system
MVFRLWERKAFDLIVSPEIVAEYARVLTEPDIRAAHRMSDEEFAAVMAGFATLAIHVAPMDRLNVVPDDLTDNKFVECAVAGHADYIVSGDKHLLALGSYQGIQIVPPAIFVKLFATDDPAAERREES